MTRTRIKVVERNDGTKVFIPQRRISMFKQQEHPLLVYLFFPLFTLICIVVAIIDRTIPFYAWEDLTEPVDTLEVAKSEIDYVLLRQTQDKERNKALSESKKAKRTKNVTYIKHP